jgi:ribosomal protein L24
LIIRVGDKVEAHEGKFAGKHGEVIKLPIGKDQTYVGVVFSEDPTKSLRWVRGCYLGEYVGELDDGE